MSEYLLFYKERLPLRVEWQKHWDIFVSAFNSSQRVQLIADRIKATDRFWLILPEYHYGSQEYPNSGHILSAETDNEAELISQFLDSIPDLTSKRLLFDITGFISHYVLVLLEILARKGVQQCDMIYGEPVRYLHSERTKFSDEAVMEVRQIAGFEGMHTIDTNDDLLILAVGYDYRLVAEVASFKEHARKVQLFGLPSLRPDMYQEGLLMASKVAEAVGPDASHPPHFQYAPAHDPFVTASVISAIAREHLAQHPRSNIYLAPLSTKPQALGFAVYYLRECKRTATSIVYPFCRTYMRETSEGLGGAWLYRLELNNLFKGS